MTLHQHFNELIGTARTAIELAQAKADVAETPVGVWERDGWFVISDIAPDSFEDCGFAEPESEGWQVYAVVDPFNV